MKKEFQAKQITDALILKAVRGAQGSSSASRWDIHAIFPNTPKKVVDAKLRAATMRGLLEGCNTFRCAHGKGCRGNYKVVEDAL